MRALLKKPFFFSSVIFAVLLTGFILINSVFGWTNPSGNPPSGGGILYYVNSKLGIGTSTPPYLVSISSSTDSLLGLFRQGGTIPTIFRQGTDNAFVINSNNSDIIKIKGGNVGIGTSGDPSAKLEVAGQIKITGGTPADGKVLVSNASGLASWQASSTGILPAGASGQTLRHDGTNWVANSVIYNNGTNIGMGTTTPTYHLEVVGSGIQRIRVNSSDNQAGIGFFSDNSGEAVLYSPDGTDDLAAYVGGANRLYVNSAGNVGIGTTNPNSKLQINYSADTSSTWWTDGVSGLLVQNDHASGDALLKLVGSTTGIGRIVYGNATAADKLIISSRQSTNATGKMVAIDNNGNVGIGTAGPNQALTLTSGALCLSDNSSGDCGTGNQAGDLMFGNSSGGSGSQFEYFNGKLYIGTLASAWHMIIQDNGNVGIGTAGPTARLEVNGAVVMGGGNANLDPAGSLDDTIFSSLANNGKSVIGWNRAAGGGETDFIANRDGGSVGGFKFYDYTNAGVLNHLVTIQGGGNVGIGTESPSTNLDINGNLRIRSKTSCGKLYSDSSGNVLCGTDQTGGGLGGSGTTNNIAKWSNSSSLTNSIIIDNGTQVGIGVTPGSSARLEAAGGQQFGVVGSGSYAGVIGQGGSYGVYAASGSVCSIEGHAAGTGDAICGVGRSYFSGDVVITGGGTLELDNELLNIGGITKTLAWSSGWYECNAGGGLIILIKGLCTNFGGATPYTTVSGPHNIMFGD